jgi:hypothetical protein
MRWHCTPADVALLKSAGFQVHRPTVFFLSDGQPTDSESAWRARLEELRGSDLQERPNVLAVGVGGADAGVIRQLASAPRYAFMMADGSCTAGAIAEFAASMLNSMVSSAESLDRGAQTIEFEKPEGFVQLHAPLVQRSGDASAPHQAGTRAADDRRAGADRGGAAGRLRALPARHGCRWRRRLRAGGAGGIGAGAVQALRRWPPTG